MVIRPYGYAIWEAIQVNSIFQCNFISREKKARKTISFDFWIHIENFWGVLFLQEYLNVRFKETGHSNMYFPQVCCGSNI